jgi:hypothetical protein
MNNERDRIERKMLRRHNVLLGYVLIGMFIMAVGAMCATLIFGDHVW